MKKIIVSSALVIAIVGYVLYQHGHTAPIAENKSAPIAALSNAGAGMYKDGTYTGNVADAYYGNLQVAVTIAGGMISDVTFPQYPNTAGHTIQLSGQVMPELKSEAIAAQSAKVNIISGATQDSQAFQKSLASALALAQN